MKFQTLSQNYFEESVQLLLDLELDIREEIEHHLTDMDAHLICLDGNAVVGIVGWYKDNVNYANEAMGDLFPGEDAFWVGFFGVKSEYQNKGIGTQLLSLIEENIRERGANEWWVSSVPEAKEFYEKKGFSVVCSGEISGNKKVFMRKKLSD